MLHIDHWICEIAQTRPKDSFEIVDLRRSTLEEAIGALTLTVEGNAAFSHLATYWESSFLGSGAATGGITVPTSGVGGRINITYDNVKLFKSNYQMMHRLQTDNKLKHLLLPFRRLRLAAERATTEDRLVDYVIGLESLLAPDSGNPEVTVRFKLRGAALLPGSFGSARERIDFMNKLYGLRSRIVHGTANPKEVNDYLPRAEKVLKTIFLWHLRHDDTSGSVEDIIRKLDEALVVGGSAWAYPSVPDDEA
jgi:hypothetical protein